MKLKAHKKKAFIHFLILIFLLSLFFYSLTKLPIRINLTSSVKQGIYILSSPVNIKRGDYIALCLSSDISQNIHQKGYIRTGHDCHGKYESLLKKIVAIPKDEIEVHKNFILTNGQKIRLTIQEMDRNNQPIPKKNYTNKFRLKGYWVIGDNNPNSFDSRYFGEISKNQILYKAKPWILF